MEACEALLILPNNTRSIDEHLDIGHASKKHENRKVLLTISENMRFLARQGIPFRKWSEESNEINSNFMQLLLLRSVDNPNISQWLSRKNYTYVSKDIQNEIARLMAHKIMRDITSNLQAEFYSILADEITDVSNKDN